MDILNIEEDSSNINPYKVSVITAIGPNNLYSKFIERYF